eukprot:5577780-Pyramimonas_sp.AAC.1
MRRTRRRRGWQARQAPRGRAPQDKIRGAAGWRSGPRGSPPLTPPACLFLGSCGVAPWTSRGSTTCATRRIPGHRTSGNVPASI